MKTAIIDCGTNTFNLLVCDVAQQHFLYKDKISVRLAEGNERENFFSPSTMERALAALKQHKDKAMEEGCSEIYAVATAAFRNAENRAELTDRAEHELGIKINLIDGDTEAKLIHQGVALGLEFKEVPSLIMDIGGGSTEFILLIDKKPVWQGSFPLGSSVMLQQFRPADPILTEEIEAFENHLDEVLAPLHEACQGRYPRVLIGSSGSFDTLAQMCVENFQSSSWDAEDSSYTFVMHEYMQMSQRMIKSTFEERLETPGMIPMRADMMVMACLEINYIIKRFGVRLLQQCNFALKEGLLASLQTPDHSWQRSSL